MSQTCSEKALLLHKEAKKLLENAYFWEPFEQGKIYPSGSYFLDLLASLDLDVYFVPGKTKKSVEDIFANAAKFYVKHASVVSIRVEKALHTQYTTVPKGYYLQVKIEVPSGNIWQVDIWTLSDKRVLDKLLNETNILKSKIDPKTRALILKTKNAILRPDGSTPSFSSYYIYKAILEEGLKGLKDIKAYLVQNGIKLT